MPPPLPTSTDSGSAPRAAGLRRTVRATATTAMVSLALTQAHDCRRPARRVGGPFRRRGGLTGSLRFAAALAGPAAPLSRSL